MKTRLGIVGAGAIGCVVGGLLTKAGHDVTLIDQWPEHVETMRRCGLRLTGTCGDHTIAVSALHLHEAQSIVEPFELLFIAVKSYDTEWATRLGVQYLNDDGLVVDFQNGINDYRVAAIAGAHRTLGCVITIGAARTPGGSASRSASTTAATPSARGASPSCSPLSPVRRSLLISGASAGPSSPSTAC